MSGENKPNEQKPNEEKNQLGEFEHIIKDFVKDILTTFPEYADKLNEDLRKIVCDEDDEAHTALQRVKEYCQTVYPERFFDILYQNADLFSEENSEEKNEEKSEENNEENSEENNEENSEGNTFFLPDIEFKDLWKCDISDKTRETIWKYLQLVLFAVVHNISDKDSFGNTAKLFEAINEDEFKGKLEETINQLQDMFDVSNTNMEEGDISGINLENLPDPEELHSHITGMLGGKLGQLAQEIAEETAQDLNTDINDSTSVNDVFQKLFKNPGKLMDLVKNVGSKLDGKIKSGELKESELMEEASELMKKMKEMPGMNNIESMLGKMGGGLGGLGGKGGKINVNAMQSHMQQNMRKAKLRERLQAKQQHNEMNRQLSQGAAPNELVFSTGEKVEKSERLKQVEEPQVEKKKKRRKKKKKKPNN